MTILIGKDQILNIVFVVLFAVKQDKVIGQMEYMVLALNVVV